MKSAGSSWDGDAGCAWGVWSTEAAGRLELDSYIDNKKNRDIPGVARFPRNLISGVRSACAAEARRALVANILQTDPIGRGSRQEEILVSRERVVGGDAACFSSCGGRRRTVVFVEMGGRRWWSGTDGKLWIFLVAACKESGFSSTARSDIALVGYVRQRERIGTIMGYGVKEEEQMRGRKGSLILVCGWHLVGRASHSHGEYGGHGDWR